MKNKFLYAFTALAVMFGAVACDTTEELPGDPDDGNDVTPAVRTVSVGVASGTMTVGEVGTVTFDVTTENFEDGTFDASVSLLPAGVAVLDGEVTIADNAGTLTLSGTPSKVAVIENMRLTLDGVVSEAVFTLTVEAAPVVGDPKITVNNPNAPIQSGSAGIASFDVTVENITDDEYILTSENITLPEGITIGGLNAKGVLIITGGKGKLYLDVASSVSIGKYTLTLKLDGATSGEFQVVVVEKKTAVIGAQVTPLTNGTAGSTTFVITTTGYDDGKTHSHIIWYPNSDNNDAVGGSTTAPAGISVSATSVSANKMTVTVNTTASVANGSYYFRVAFDGLTGILTLKATLTVDAPSGFELAAQEDFYGVWRTDTGMTLTLDETSFTVDLGEGMAHFGLTNMTWVAGEIHNDATEFVVTGTLMDQGAPYNMFDVDFSFENPDNSGTTTTPGEQGKKSIKMNVAKTSISITTNDYTYTLTK